MNRKYKFHNPDAAYFVSFAVQGWVDVFTRFETQEGFRFWRGDNKPIELWSNSVIKQKLDYIHNNPVEEGLVFRPEDRYSSAIDYAGGKGMLDIVLIG